MRNRLLSLLLCACLLIIPVCAAETDEAYMRSGPFTYENTDAEVSFPVPDGWSQYVDPADAPNEAYFFSDSDGCYFYFYAADYWAELPEDAQDAIDPASLDLSAYSETELEDYFYLPSGSLAGVTYGSTPYYLVEETLTDDEIDETATITEIITANNGFLYYFQFDGTTADSSFTDVEFMLAGLDFHADSASCQPSADVPDSEPEPSQSEPTDTISDLTRRYLFIGLSVVLILAVLIVVCLVVARNGRKHRHSGTKRYLNGEEVTGDGDCDDDARALYRRRGPELDYHEDNHRGPDLD